MNDLILPLEKQVSTLESSIILRDLGVPQRSLFYWADVSNVKGNPGHKWVILNGNCDKLENYSAFTVAELGELLGDRFHSNMEKKRVARRSGWYCKWFGNSYDDSCIEFSLTEAEARAKMLCYLIERGLIDAKR